MNLEGWEESADRWNKERVQRGRRLDAREQEGWVKRAGLEILLVDQKEQRRKAAI